MSQLADDCSVSRPAAGASAWPPHPREACASSEAVLPEAAVAKQQRPLAPPGGVPPPNAATCCVPTDADLLRHSEPSSIDYLSHDVRLCVLTLATGVRPMLLLAKHSAKGTYGTGRRSYGPPIIVKNMVTLSASYLHPPRSTRPSGCHGTRGNTYEVELR